MRQALAIALAHLSRRAALVPALALAVLFSALPGATGVTHAAAAPLKAVIIVGPTHDLTASNLQSGETLALLAESYGMDVRRVFHPKATWANVLANIQGANLVAYLGHGNGWPSPYGPFQEKTKNGFGLNPYEGAGKNTVEYYGANKIRNNVVLAPKAIVLLNHLCYSAGNGEGDDIPTWSIAHQRVDNFAAGFLYVGAKAVFAYRSGSVATVINQLFTTDKTIEGIFKTTESWSGWNGTDPRKLDSARMPGNVNFLDPHATKGFERAVSGDLDLTADSWRSSPAGGSGSGGSVAPPTADTTPPSVPQDLSGTPLGYRRISLVWQPSTDNSGGEIKYQIFRNGTKIAATTNAFFTDRPAYAGTYKYKVRAKDVAGNKSAFSTVVSAQAIKGELTGALAPDTTSPSVPQGLTAESLGYRRVGLSWQPSSDDRPGTIRYRVFRNGVRIATVTTASFTDRPDLAGTYKYKVRAVDVAGNKSDFSVVVQGAAVKGPL